MTDINEIREAHKIVDRIYTSRRRNIVRKFLPPRPEPTFRETIDALNALVPESDVHVSKLIDRLDRLEKSHKAHVAEGEELTLKNAPEGSLAAQNGEVEVWRKGVSFWHSKGTDLLLEDEKMEKLGFKMLRWGLGGN